MTMANCAAQPLDLSPPSDASGLRIALFSGNYNCVRDGANRALNRLTAFLIGKGAAVRVYSPTVAQPAFAPAGDLVSVPSIPLPGRPEYRAAIGLPMRLREDVRDFAPTHVHLSSPDLLGGRALAMAKKHGWPVIASMHTRFETYPAHYHMSFLAPAVRARLRSFYRQSDYVLAPNEPMAASLDGLGVPRERVRIWGRGVDRDMFTPALRSREWRLARGYGGDEPVILFFGRLVREKGLDMFVETIDALRRRGRPIRPLLIGEGPDRLWLEARLPGACFAGHLEDKTLGRAVASADILVNPSVTEAFGNVNLEAMASGLAIVSADVGSAQALIENGRTGLLVDPRKPEAYADAVEALIDSPARRRGLGLAALAASSLYSWPDILQAVVDVYNLVGL